MKREITVLVCVVVLGDGRYLSDDRKNYISESDFEFKGLLKENFNTKRQVEVYAPEDRLTDGTKTERNEELTEQSKDRTEFPEGKNRREDPMVIRVRHKKKMYATRILSEDFDDYSVAESRYGSSLLPDYVLYFGHISARTESTRG